MPALKYPVQMHRMATVEQFREEVRRLATAEPDADLAVCEGMEHRVSKIMHPQDQLEKANRDRDLFVIEVPKLDWPGAQICDDLLKLEDDMDIGESSFIGPLTREAFLKEPTGAADPLDLTPSLPMAVPQLRLQDQEETLPWPKCNICLEEVEISCRPLKHGDHCDCEVDPDVDFVVMTSINSKCKPSKWVLTITVVFRVDEEGAEYNNQRNSKLYGNPRVLHLPNKISGAQLYEFLQPYAPSPDFTVLQVGGNGLFCSVCLFNSHCKGCALSSSPDEEIELQPNSMLAVRTTQLPAEQPLTVEHPSLLQRRKEEKLTLDDCLDAFTQPETLDAENPWFVFHEGRSIKLDNKVAFPLKGLTLKEASAGSRRSGSLYDLYSCVCHIGGTTGSGHYMSYTRNPVSLEWYRYNDSSVLRQRPELEDHNQAYVLFYQRSDLATAPAVL
ncbi:UNVERIFIED_CONTAM: hypothetical protein B566_EDAN017973 [Ephemera danica]|nr:hypothetical protein B566_EDAN017973 [Ephemera danica]